MLHCRCKNAAKRKWVDNSVDREGYAKLRDVVIVSAVRTPVSEYVGV
jgi:hypothetical protein